MTTDKTTQDTSASPSAENANTSKESLGAWFAQVRTQAGLEQQDVARSLRLNPILIRAIENDDYAALGPPVFVRGYLSRYAQLLDIPEQPVLEHYREQSEAARTPPPLQVVHPPQYQTRFRDLSGLVYLLIVVAIGWFAIQNMGSLDPTQWLTSQSEDSQVTASESKEASASTSADASSTQTYYPFQAESDKGENPSTTPSETVANTQESSAQGTELETTVSPQTPSEATATLGQSTTPTILPVVVETATAATTPAPGVADPLPNANPAAEADAGDTASLEAGQTQLAMEFSADCWLEIKDADGKVLARGVMKAKSDQKFLGKPPFSIKLGNAPAARITLGKKLIDKAVYVPKRGTVSRFTLNGDG